MKTTRIIISSICLSLVVLSGFYAWGQRNVTKLRHGSEQHKDNFPKLALAYVEDYRKGIPDDGNFTHLIYSFVEFNDECDGIVIKYPEKLQAMVDLKRENPDLQVLVSVGGYKREGFSEMARDGKKRKAFVKALKQLVDSLQLDGVDLDWEFPTTEAGGHTANRNDSRNYVTLVKDLRKAMGKEKWISYYSDHGAAFIDHKKMVPYVSYVHVSGYNLSIPKEGQRAYHQSPLYASSKIGGWCVSKSIARHIDLGIPKEKILMGIPFYGRGKTPFPTYAECPRFDSYSAGTKIVWDNDAQAPYYADENGDLVLGFDDERSIKAKFDFIRANGLPGVFVWNYDGDYPDRRLSRTIGQLRK